MAKMVTYLLKREPLSDQMCGTGVSQRMWAVLMALYIQGSNTLCHQVVQAAGGHRSQRCPERQEQRPRRASGPNKLQVAQYRFAHISSERVLLFAALLRTRHLKDATLPIYIIQRKRNDLTRTQAVYGKQKQYGMIADILGLVCGGAGYESTNVFPLGPYW
jgi:hypothetical protein